MHYLSHADLGGKGGFGPILPQPEAEVFHAAWEARVFGLTLAMGAVGSWNLDMARSARETLPNYLELSYYAIWLGGLERLLSATGLVGADELAAGRALRPAAPIHRVLAAKQVPSMLARGSPTERPAPGPAQFAPGQRVRTRSLEPPHHTRLPTYLRGRTGVVERVLGAHVFADAHARGLGEDPQWLYTVVFDSRDLWEGAAGPGHRVSFDAWQPYLENP